MDGDVGWAGRYWIGSSTIEEDVLRKVHVIMDTTPVACSRMIANNTFDDAVLADKTLCGGRVANERKDLREDVKQ